METVGMILCGGFGKRLRPVTETVPKPLVELKEDYTILDKQLFDFKSAGIEVKRLSDEFYNAGSAGRDNQDLKERFNAARNRFYEVK